MDEKTVTIVGSDSLAQLLQGPGSRRVARNITMHYPPVLMFHDDQDVDQLERSGHNDAEVTAQAIRSSPHDGLLIAISRISRRSSTGIGGRPGRDFQLQNKRKP